MRSTKADPVPELRWEPIDMYALTYVLSLSLYIYICIFIHSFIADIYIAPLQVGLLRSAPNPSAAE